MITSRGAPAPLFIFTMVIMNGIKFIEPGTNVVYLTST